VRIVLGGAFDSGIHATGVCGTSGGAASFTHVMCQIERNTTLVYLNPQEQAAILSENGKRLYQL
jgi:hypothetical protein